MRTLITGLGASLCLLLASTGAWAQEMSFRSGVVTDIDTIQVPENRQQEQEPSKAQSAVGRAVGRTVKRALWRAALNSSSEHAYDTYDVASGAVDDTAEVVVENRSGQAATAYLVMIRFDDGSQSAIQAVQVDELQVGGRVRVFGSGESARIMPE
ncbi:hypothetical protein [Marilutibacter chinensis]|uniref:Uncharacterized protein n=1 Tax=Marilutibacter chinensis TaxID=2912247 RepID=A0ABS9HYA6_9GAMM|nr:hypothetical protein [Lysobacter chinensis]MCF7223335.1 hypothetical protein [Lysobacter chinensis]